MKTLVSVVASLALFSRPAAGENRSAVGRSRGFGSRAPPLASSWASKAASVSGTSRRGTGRALTPSTSTSGGAGAGQAAHRGRRRPQPAPGSPDELARLRGGWLGVDLVQEIAKAYLSPPAASASRGDDQAAAAAAAAATASDRSYQGGGRGRGAADGGDAATANAATGRAAASAAAAGKNGGSGSGNGGGRGGGGVNSRDAGRSGGADEGRVSEGGSSGGGGGGGVQGKMSRLRTALQQVGDISSSSANPPAPSTNGPAAATPGGRGSHSGSSGISNGRGNNNPSRNTNSEGFPSDLGRGGSHSNAPESSRSNAAAPAAAAGSGPSGIGFNGHSSNSGGGSTGGGGGGGGQHNNVGAGAETEWAGAGTVPAPSGEDEQRWEDRAAGAWGGSGSGGGGGNSFGGGFEAEVEGGVSPPGEGEAGRAEEEEEDQELVRARAAAHLGQADAAGREEAASAKASVDAAARAQNEIALLRQIETVQDRALDRPQEAVPWGYWGQYTRSVVTNVMPARFIDEVGAHIASALALAAFKGLIYAVMNMRGQKKAEKVAFKDVVGCDEAKEEIKQIVDFLVDPSAYDSLGATRPKGILLVGPPGTGKTLIAKACAGEAGVPFLYACGSDFNGMYVGMGVAAVKRIFAKARKHKKSIIYIDEIDYLGRARGGGSREASGATQDREATLNQLLSEMDGFEGKDGIVVMASTNRKEILDDALLRSGRFDMQVDVERPDRRGREQLFSKYIAPLKLAEEENSKATRGSGGGDHGRGGRGGRYFGGGSAAMAAAEKEKQAAINREGLREDIAKELADMTPYMTGADVANVCATAGRIAARAGSDSVVLEHFSAAVDRVLHGLEKPDKQVSKEDKERTAIHEAGHAVAAWMLPWCDEVVKVSIVWRGNALGFSQTAMVERQSQMREMVLDSVCMTLAGRAAEEVVCQTISGGASSDLRVASRQLYSAITEVGFGSASLLAPGNRQLSEKIMAEVDEEVQTLLAQQYQRALALVRTHRDKIDTLAKALLEQNVVHKADLRRILGDKVTLESEEAAAEAALNSAPPKGDGGEGAAAPGFEQDQSVAAANAEAHGLRNTDAPAKA